jgi:hypothetical protein
VDGGVTRLGLCDTFEEAWGMARAAIPPGAMFRIAGMANGEGKNGEGEAPAFAAFIVETEEDEFILAVLNAR